MKLYVTFSDDAILGGTTLQERSLEDQNGVTIPRKTQLASTEVSTEEAAPTEEPNEETDHTEVTTKEVAPTGEPIKGPTIPAATVSKPAEEMVTPQVWHEEKGKGEVPHSDFPSWTKVLHPPKPVITTGQSPLTLDESRQRHCSQSVGGGELSIKEWKNTDKPCRQSWIPHHHLGLMSPCQRFTASGLQESYGLLAEGFLLAGTH